MTTLSPIDKAAIHALGRSHMELTTAGLAPFFKRGLWIGKTNHYSKDVVARLKAALPVSSERKRNLAQYIAASCALHSSDGWSYLGRAFACILNGDTHRALHLAYYAELRAAMSLLASTGIGIFNQQHFVVPSANSTSKLRVGLGTHVACWLVLEEWSKLATSGNLFASLIRPEGRTLDDWFHGQGGANTLAPQAKDWFMQWGMDLGLAIKDRDARNESSYRPDGVPVTWTLNAKEGLNFVRDTWNSLEPSTDSSFQQIDRHILRLAVERSYKGQTGLSPDATNPGFAAFIKNIVSAQALTEAADRRLQQFLLRRDAPADPAIFTYSARKPVHGQTDAFAVISRAVLLLRVATGSAQDLLQQAGFDAAALSFWWEKLGEVRGLWKPGSTPEVLSDLWADIEESLRDVDAIEANDPTAFETMNGIAYGQFGRLNLLSSHERVGLWGLCPA